MLAVLRSQFPGSSRLGKTILWVEERIKLWKKPATSVLIIGALSALTRSRTELVVENALLRQQLIVLNRQVKRLQLTNPSRLRRRFLSHFTTFWRQALVLATSFIRSDLLGKTVSFSYL